MNYIKNFSKSRSQKLGASEVTSCLIHPSGSGSIAGYDNTALTVWELKTGRRQPDFAGRFAEMGNFLEPKILYYFISEKYDKKIANDFFRGYMLCELDKKNDGYPDAESFQNTRFLHHTTAENDYAISHADCIEMLSVNTAGSMANNTANIIEAKSRSNWILNKKDDLDMYSHYNHYNSKLKGHQGVALKDYIQVQFQAAIYNDVYGIQFDKLYLAALFDRDPFHFWEFEPDTKIQERLLEVAHYMKQCIDNDTPPKKLAMNQEDVKIMYKKINEDYRVLADEEAKEAVQIAKDGNYAAKQEKMWKQKTKECRDALSIFLQDTKTVKAIIDGSIEDVAAWQEKSGSEKIISLSEIQKRNDAKRILNYFKKNKLIKKTDDSKYVKIKLK